MNRIEKALMHGLFLHLHHNTDKALDFAAFKRLNDVVAQTSPARLLIGPDANDDAGVVGIDNHFIVGKMESHCSPSAVRPYDSAGTGVGGACRDVVAMGGQPLFIMDFIGTMPLDKEILVGPCAFKGVCTCGACKTMTSHERTNLMLAGIRDMARALGVYVAGGGFSTSFSEIVPAVVVAVIGKLVTQKPLTKPAKRPGDALILVGQTGTDGNDTLFRAGATETMKPAQALFQEERASMDAMLNVFRKHESSISACSDLGAAGIGAAVCESMRYGGYGAQVDLALMPTRDNPTPEELLVCESQARMLLQVNHPDAGAVLDTIRQTGAPAARIGHVVNGTESVFVHDGTPVATIPNAITEAQLAQIKS